MDLLFYINLLMLVLSVFLVARKSSTPRKFVLLNVLASLIYSSVFLIGNYRTAANMEFLIEYYWILTIAIHWFLILAFFVFKKRN